MDVNYALLAAIGGSAIALAIAYLVRPWWAKIIAFLVGLGAAGYAASLIGLSAGLTFLLYAILLGSMAALALTDHSKKTPGDRNVIIGIIFLLLAIVAFIIAITNFDSSGTIWDLITVWLQTGWSIIVMLWDAVVNNFPFVLSAAFALIFMTLAYRLTNWLLKILAFVVGLGAAAAATALAGVPVGVAFLIYAALFFGMAAVAFTKKTPGEPNVVIGIIFVLLGILAGIYGLINLDADGTIWDTIVLWFQQGWEIIMTLGRFFFNNV